MRVVVVALLLVVGACDARVTGTSAYGGEQSTSSASAALIGRWAFTRYFEDDAGSVHLSTTVWEFLPGGVATRTVYADNVSAGVGDAVVTVGRWTADSRTISIRLGGSATATPFDYRFEGGALILGGLTFTRLSS